MQAPLAKPLVVVDWPNEYKCVKAKTISAVRKAKHIDSFDKYYNSIPAACKKQFSAENEYPMAPFVALYTYKRAVLVSSLTDLAAAISAQGNGITSLRIVGHGRSGSVSVGAGEGDDASAEIDVNNERTWKRTLRNSPGYFINHPTIYLQGCAVATQPNGDRFLKMLSEFFNNATIYASIKPGQPDKKVESGSVNRTYQIYDPPESE